MVTERARQAGRLGRAAGSASLVLAAAVWLGACGRDGETGTPSASFSAVSVTSGPHLVGAREPARVTVLVRDAAGRHLDGRLVRLDYAGAGIVAPAEARTAGGQARFTVSATAPTRGTLRATVDPGPMAVVVDARPELAFDAGYRVRGAVTGLDRAGLVLSSPGLPDLEVPADAVAFAFDEVAGDGAPYQVAVGAQPHGLVCSVLRGEGTLGGADVADVEVSCGQAWRAMAPSPWNSWFLGLKADGSLWGWGGNELGQLGDGSFADRHLPGRIGTSGGWTAAHAGAQFATALHADGSRWAWGWNSWQYGDGGAIDSSVPIRIEAAHPWSALSAGPNHVLALRVDGSLWAWGMNSAAQLGDGSTVERPSPARIGGDADWSTVAAGLNASYAIKRDGTLWAWGTGFLGAEAAPRYSPVPIQVGAGRDWASVKAGERLVLALKADGTLWTWGDLAFLQGGGPAPAQDTPARMGEDADWSVIAAGADHGVALKADGSLWAWGANWRGQLGTGSTSPEPAPRRIGLRTDWVAIAAGATCTFAIGRGGDLWAWGTGCLGFSPEEPRGQYLDGVEVKAPAR